MSISGKIGAFFDLDGTLLPGPSLEWRFIAWLTARDEIGAVDVARWVAQFAGTVLRDPRAATIGNKAYLRGLRESLAEGWENSLSVQPFAAGLARLQWHAAQGHRVFIVSGTLAHLARAFARRFAAPAEAIATELEACDGRWTGDISGRHMSGEEKARAIRRVAARSGLSLWESYAYGNSVTDLPMLDSVGHRVAVNPPLRLRRIARSEGWQSCVWNERLGSAAVGRQELSPGEAR